MNLKLENILNSLILEEDGGGPIFNDYVPVYILDQPTTTTFKLSTSDEEIKGTIQSSTQDHEKISKGQKLNVYTFELGIGSEKRVIQLLGQEVNSDKNSGAPTLFKNVPYSFVSGDNLVDTTSGENDTEVLYNDLMGFFKFVNNNRKSISPDVFGESDNTFEDNKFILEVNNVKGTITFTDFDLSDSEKEITDDFDEFYENYKGDLDALERYGFMLYGKDAGKLFSKMSFKYRDLKNIIGLGRGDIYGRMEKRQDKYNLRDITTSGDKTMLNLPKFLLQFLEDVKWEDNKGNKIRIPKNSILPFNWDKSEKRLIHKQSSKKYTNVSQIIISMSKEPEIDKDYTSEKIIGVIPLKSEVIESQPNIKVNFKIISE